ncbi:hypothetical protein [Streptococcus pantholopis]|uniref:Uncharacterized protein n=1 Tax=Streptococcus pantholopis TaxID=1811193 RepID=A0A172Q7B3_9STRE|nr:hypothetical protein A0O21_04455 [Streptococcus pantholopis]
MASGAGITLTAIFFTRILGRVQFIKIQRPLKTQKENRGLTAESLKTLGKAVFFAKSLARVQFIRYKVH